MMKMKRIIMNSPVIYRGDKEMNKIDGGFNPKQEKE